MPVELLQTYGLGSYWELKAEEQLLLDRLLALPADLKCNLRFQMTDPLDLDPGATPSGPWGVAGSIGCRGPTGGDTVSEIPPDRRSTREKEIAAGIAATQQELKVLQLRKEEQERQLFEARAERHRSAPRTVSLYVQGTLAADRQHLLDGLPLTTKPYYQQVRSADKNLEQWLDEHEEWCSGAESCSYCQGSREEMGRYTYTSVLDPSKVSVEGVLPFSQWEQLLTLYTVTTSANSA
jgi:hypothetical protein